MSPPQTVLHTPSAGQRIPLMQIKIPLLISALTVSASAVRFGWRQVDHSSSTVTDAPTTTSPDSTATFPTSTNYAPPGSLIGRATGSDDAGGEYTCTCTPKSSIRTRIGIPIQTGGVNENGI
ncbi:hypothetical protein IW262DRAFT_4723 [Armillaria fumosa]|nr:hypothetical protein IW262DRAFT_4723 [Armillaria fumosa]